MSPTPTLEADPGLLRESASEMRCRILDALALLEGLPPHPQRTRVGRHLLDAHRILGAWVEDGTMDTSKGVL